MIGVNALNFITADSDQYSNLNGLADHIDHLVNLVSVKHVRFGFDLCDRFNKDEHEKK